MNILLFAPEAWPIDDTLLDPQRHQIERVKGSLSELIKVATTQQPDLVLLTGFATDAYLPKVLENLCVAMPAVTVAVYQPQVSTGQLMELMRAGVRDVITDCQPATVQQVLQRALARLQSA